MSNTMEDAILNRRTVKVLAQNDFPVREIRGDLTEILRLAGMAPFHRACDERHRGPDGLLGIEPWRFYVVDAEHCRLLRQRIPTEKAGKIPSMLAAASALVMATWLPNDTSSTPTSALFEPTLANMEHIAACSAAIQNLLLAATDRDIANYWSSGGVLREREVFELLGIPTGEILLGAVFLFPSETLDADVVGSKLRERRGQPAHWSRWVTFASNDDVAQDVSESPS